MITDQDSLRLQKDFRNVFTTKEDLKLFATKKDLDRFVTKEDFEENNQAIAVTFGRIEADLAELKVGMKKLLELMPAMYSTLVNHEQRISTLESKNPLN